MPLLASHETPHAEGAHVAAGDSHTMALTEQGFIVGWGTFRNSSGVFSFSPHERLALLPCLVYSPTAPAGQAVKIVSGSKQPSRTKSRSDGTKNRNPSHVMSLWLRCASEARLKHQK